MERHCHNAMEVASYLETHEAVAHVNYTGLPSHPDHSIAMKQLRHSGAMMSFELKQGLQGGIDFMNKLQMCVRTVSLGTCDTLLSHPASMTHYSVPKEEREKYGITEFFFSSRRRHTRWNCDWSSDVCSSDLHDIFDLSDPSENNFFYRAANALHIKTQPWFIRSYLLFRKGDYVEARLIDETERLIRQNSTVYDVEIRPVRYENGVVDILVRTRDTWTLQPGIRVRRAGGKNTGAFNIKESNLAGTGTSLGLERSTSVDRTGTLLTLQHDHLFDGCTSIALQRARYDDGHNNSLNITRPFYALDTRWAAGASVSDFSQLDSFYQAGNNVAQYRHDQKAAGAFAGYSAGLVNGWARRYTAGVSYAADEYAFESGRPPPPQLPPDRTLAGPFLRYEVIQDDYLQTMNRDLIQRPEYLTMGFASTVQVGRSLGAFGATEQPWQISANASKGFRFQQAGHQMLASANYSTLYGSSVGDSPAMGAAVRYYAPQKEPLLFYFAASTDHVHSSNQADDLLLGGDNGLRGYPLRYQRGQHRTLFTFEERYY